MRQFLLSLFLVAGLGAPALAMDFVVIGEPCNPTDVVYGCGRVDYVFEMAKYKITNEEYAAFCNAVARKGDPFNVYSESMMRGVLGGIDRTEQNGEYTYRAKPGWKRRPVVYVSWYDIARMANWYHYGQPNDGTSRLGTTEGANADGAYDTRHFPTGFGDEMDYARLPRTRNAGALYWIPSDDEWYKAAYYDPDRLGNRPYWDYAVRTCNLPNNLPPPGDAHSVNYLLNNTYSIGRPYILTEVSAYPKAASYFGTYDQNGDVWEWVEDWKQMRIDPRHKGRITRGGSATYTEIGLYAGNADPLNPAHEAFVFGARLARAHITESGEVIYSEVYRGLFPDLHKRIVAVLTDARSLKVLFVGAAMGATLAAIVFLWLVWRLVRPSAASLRSPRRRPDGKRPGRSALAGGGV